MRYNMEMPEWDIVDCLEVFEVRRGNGFSFSNDIILLGKAVLIRG